MDKVICLGMTGHPEPRQEKPPLKGQQFNRLDNSKTGGYTQSRKGRCDKRLALRNYVKDFDRLPWPGAVISLHI